MKSTLNIKNLLLFIGIGTVIAGTTVSCKDDPLPPAPSTTIVDIAAADPTLSILVSAVTKAGLAGRLSTTANLTVFAPTNDAFIASGYPQSVIDGLNADQIRDVLTPILTYHVVGAKVMADGVPASDTVKTLNGLNIFASKNANGVFVNGIRVTTADIAASNGVIHKISSKVLVPPTQTIAQIVIATPSLSTLLAALQYADNGAPGLVAALSGPGKFTVFAPDNAAFTLSGVSLGGATPPTPVAVTNIIRAHVIGTNVFSSDLVNDLSAPTLNNTASVPQRLVIKLPALTVGLQGSVNPVSDINTAGVDIVAKNGVVHLVRRVIL